MAQTARRSQEELQATQPALAHAARVTTLGEMSASIAHEVSQPLASISPNLSVSGLARRIGIHSCLE
jgi:C4-dicarboxylate-specific signal transduction histidine kinase